MAKRGKSIDLVPGPHPDYGALLSGISDLLGQAGQMQEAASPQAPAALDQPHAVIEQQIAAMGPGVKGALGSVRGTAQPAET